MHNQIIFEFIKCEFPVKRIKTTRKKWSNAIVVPEGYLRKKRQAYQTKNNLDKARLAADMIQIVVNVFGCNELLAQELTLKYFKLIRF